MTCLACPSCDQKCVTCDNFETHVELEDSLYILQHMKKKLLKNKFVIPETFSDKIAELMVNSVSTMIFFWVCLCLCLLPILIPEQRDNILYLSNSFQLTLLPIILIASAKQAQRDQIKDEHEYRITLLNDRIEQLRLEGIHKNLKEVN